MFDTLKNDVEAEFAKLQGEFSNEIAPLRAKWRAMIMHLEGKVISDPGPEPIAAPVADMPAIPAAADVKSAEPSPPVESQTS